MSFRNNDKVRMLDGDRWVYGFVTIADGIFPDTSKVLFEFPETGLDYWYYPNKDLIKVTEEEYESAKRIMDYLN